MKYRILVLSLIVFAHPSFACKACTIKASSNLVGNIQNGAGASASAGAGSAGMKIIAAQKAKDAFKDQKIFDSVGKDQSPDANPNWSSGIE